MGRRRSGWLALVLLWAALPAAAFGQARALARTSEADFDAEGYRAARYRAPVDRLPAPARRIALDRALRWHARGEALFVDVLPVEGGFRDPLTGRWRLSLPHATIPGAQWHPETGRAAPDPVLWREVESAVKAARKARPRLSIVVFCRADCWMGWNAARRLARGGVARVYWLAEGIDGWNASGRPLDDARPVAVPDAR